MFKSCIALLAVTLLVASVSATESTATGKKSNRANLLTKAVSARLLSGRVGDQMQFDGQQDGQQFVPVSRSSNTIVKVPATQQQQFFQQQPQQQQQQFFQQQPQQQFFQQQPQQQQISQTIRTQQTGQNAAIQPSPAEQQQIQQMINMQQMQLQQQRASEHQQILQQQQALDALIQKNTQQIPVQVQPQQIPVQTQQMPVQVKQQQMPVQQTQQFVPVQQQMPVQTQQFVQSQQQVPVQQTQQFVPVQTQQAQQFVQSQQQVPAQQLISQTPVQQLQQVQPIMPSTSTQFGQQQQSIDSLCANSQPGDIIAHPTSTFQFVVCYGFGEFTVMECPQHLVFNRFSQRCDLSVEQPSGCLSNPCLNNGRCVDMPMFTFRCECAAGFTGLACEKTDSCAVNPCGQDGVCMTLPPGAPVPHVCSCQAGRAIGTSCQTAEQNPCSLPNSNLRLFSVNFHQSLFAHCEGSRPHFLFCQQPLVFNPAKQSCDWP